MTTSAKEDLKKLANREVSEGYHNRTTVLYGDYGKRKTVTACSMVKERGLLLSSDGSWEVLEKKEHTELRHRLRIVELDGLSQFKYLDLEGFDTIIWDTVSRSVSDFVSLLLKHAKWSGNNRERLITSHQELKELESPSLADYRVVRDTFEPLFRQLFNTSSHLIFVSQMTEPIPGLGKDQRNRPMLPAATFQPIAERAALIANLRPDGRRFVADVTEGSAAYLAKSRIEGLQGKMDLDSFVSKYREVVF